MPTVPPSPSPRPSSAPSVAPNADAAPAATTPPGPGYFPPPGDAWERRRPDEVGLAPGPLDAAVRFALDHETPWPRDLAAYMRETNRREGPAGALGGPLPPRGAPNGLVLRHGYLVAEWGDTRRVDTTFSAAKSYLATLAGLALDRGLLRDLDQPVAALVDDGGFDSPHNRRVTWRHLLQQTSEWQGELWGKPDQVDHNRRLGTDSVFGGASKGIPRDLREPGTYWEYNDVRVNRLSLALLRLWRRPLPEVLREAIMDPVGASDTWQWHGYEDSWVTIDGRRMPSVAGGSHWGGGLWINSRDHARLGYLHLRRGRWGDRQLLSEAWLRTATTPCAINPVYGCLWWLNTDRGRFPSAPASSFFALGAGTNMVWIDPQHDLVAVARWIDPEAVDGFVGAVLAAVKRAG